MLLILLLFLLSCSTSIYTAEIAIITSNEKDITSSFANYDDLYFQRLLPDDKKPKDFWDKIVSVDQHDLISFDDLLERMFQKKDLDRSNPWWRKILKNQPIIPSKSILDISCNIDINPSQQDETYKCQKFFSSNATSLAWFFNQLYCVSCIKYLDVMNTDDKAIRLINKNTFLQTATIIALFEQVEIILGKRKERYEYNNRYMIHETSEAVMKKIINKLPQLLSSSYRRFNQYNLIDLYILQFINSETMHRSFNTTEKFTQILTLLNLFKAANKNIFLEGWKEKFAQEEDDNDNSSEEDQEALPEQNPAHQQNNNPHSTSYHTRILQITVILGADFLLFYYLKKSR